VEKHGRAGLATDNNTTRTVFMLDNYGHNKFNVHGSVHRNNIPIYIQQHATLHSLFITGNCSTCFGWYFHPSSGAHTTVSTTSGICHTVTAICRYCGRDGTGLSVLCVVHWQTTVSTASGISHTVTVICRYRGRVETCLSMLCVVHWQTTVSTASGISHTVINTVEAAYCVHFGTRAF
jgi:hypothetical protein